MNMWSNWHLRREYAQLNRKYFKGQLPKIRVFYGYVRSMPTASYMAFACTDRIVLQPWLRRSGKVSIYALLHEMVHIKLYALGLDAGHGPRFDKETRRLYKAGAFDNILYGA